MSGRPAYDRQSYAQDIKALRQRGLTGQAIAHKLGMHRATVYRILSETDPDQEDDD